MQHWTAIILCRAIDEVAVHLASEVLETALDKEVAARAGADADLQAQIDLLGGPRVGFLTVAGSAFAASIEQGGAY